MTKKSNTKKLALVAGAAALAALAPHAHAQSADSLINKLQQKGILTSDEAKQLRLESQQDFNNSLTNNLGKAYASMTGMPSWVNNYKISGDFRGRYDQINTTDNRAMVDRNRFRYRLRFGIVANIVDNMEVGFRLATGEAASGYSTGNPLSANSSMQDNGTKKAIYVDTAYAKWKAIDSGEWLLAATIGKMDNPFNFTPMVFDPDYTPEGASINGAYNINDQHSIAFTGAGFVLDELKTSTRDPYVYGGQLTWNAKWNSKLASSLGAGALQIGSPQQLTTGNVPYINQGSTRNAAGVLVNHYNPFIADASITYTMDSFPLYKGACPIKVGGEFIKNPGADNNNTGFWVGATLGKSGKKHTWDLTYRYEYLQADAWYDQLVDDDASVYYHNANAARAVQSGAFGGTNLKGHMVKLNYSITDYLTLSFTGYVDDLIDSKLGAIKEPNSTTVHAMADLMWKF